jgi:HSP20 family protein
MTLFELLPVRRQRRNVLARRGRGRDPFFTLERLRNELFDDFFGETALNPLDVSSDFVPRLNMNEDKKNVYLSVELPGMDQEDIEVSVTEDTLSIKGEKKQENEEKGKNCCRSERSYGSFERVISLPDAVDSEKAEAGFGKGVLTITLPKIEPEKSKVRKIDIKNK